MEKENEERRVGGAAQNGAGSPRRGTKETWNPTRQFSPDQDRCIFPEGLGVPHDGYDSPLRIEVGAGDPLYPFGCDAAKGCQNVVRRFLPLGIGLMLRHKARNIPDILGLKGET